MTVADLPPFAALAALALLGGCGPASPPEREHGLDAPVAAAKDGTKLSEMTAAIQAGQWGNVHALLVVHDGQTVYEEYFSGDDERLGHALGHVSFDADSLHDVRSISKTVTATLIGIALSRGEIPSLGTPIAELLPAYSQLLTGAKARITLRHVLTMSAGLAWDEESVSYRDERNDENRLSSSADPVAFVLGRELVSEPGEVFNYSGGLTHVLAAVLEEAVGHGIERYAAERLFRPLGIERWEWMDSGNARPSAFSGVRLRARDAANLGRLYLAGGLWEGRQLIAGEWIEEATSTWIRYPDDETPAFVLAGGYGYQWWTNRYATPKGELSVATAIGNGEQRIIVVPELSLVVVVFGGFYNESDDAWTPEHLLMRYILPSLPR